MPTLQAAPVRPVTASTRPSYPRLISVNTAHSGMASLNASAGPASLQLLAVAPLPPCRMRQRLQATALQTTSILIRRPLPRDRSTPRLEPTMAQAKAIPSVSSDPICCQPTMTAPGSTPPPRPRRQQLQHFRLLSRHWRCRLQTPLARATHRHYRRRPLALRGVP